jgi:hypothetical protein
VLVVLWVGVAATATAAGAPYYLTPLTERAFTPEHAYLAPTAVVGHGYGVVGSLFMIVGVVGYGVRKRWSALRKLGKLGDWLDVHIFLCTLGPFLVLLHTTFKFGGLVSVAFWSMTVVVFSGVFGRYVYTRIPKTIHGSFLSLEAVTARREELLTGIRGRLGEEAASALIRTPMGSQAPPKGLVSALIRAMRFDSRRRRWEREVSDSLRRAGVRREKRTTVIASLSEEARIHEQMFLLKPFQRLFHYWHVLHLPLAIVMFLILAVHVAVAVTFGYGWVLG